MRVLCVSGTSCLVIPADSMQGQLSNVPWDDFAKHWKKHRSFWYVNNDSRALLAMY
jgi:hypothetical protein